MKVYCKDCCWTYGCQFTSCAVTTTYGNEYTGFFEKERSFEKLKINKNGNCKYYRSKNSKEKLSLTEKNKLKGDLSL